MKPETKIFKVNKKHIKFILYKRIDVKEIIEANTKEVKMMGYYVKIVKKSKNNIIEIWVSENPKWYYRYFEGGSDG